MYFIIFSRFHFPRKQLVPSCTPAASIGEKFCQERIYLTGHTVIVQGVILSES
jgi:hypothetical protein